MCRVPVSCTQAVAYTTHYELEDPVIEHKVALDMTETAITR